MDWPDGIAPRDLPHWRHRAAVLEWAVLRPADALAAAKDGWLRAITGPDLVNARAARGNKGQPRLSDIRRAIEARRTAHREAWHHRRYGAEVARWWMDGAGWRVVSSTEEARQIGKRDNHCLGTAPAIRVLNRHNAFVVSCDAERATAGVSPSGAVVIGPLGPNNRNCLPEVRQSLVAHIQSLKEA